MVSNISKECNAFEIFQSESHMDMTLRPARPEFPSESISSHEEGEMKLFLFYWTRLNIEAKRIADYITRKFLLECLLCYIYIDSCFGTLAARMYSSKNMTARNRNKYVRR
jgi:hypothetical protein